MQFELLEPLDDEALAVFCERFGAIPRLGSSEPVILDSKRFTIEVSSAHIIITPNRYRVDVYKYPGTVIRTYKLTGVPLMLGKISRELRRPLFRDDSGTIIPHIPKLPRSSSRRMRSDRGRRHHYPRMYVKHGLTWITSPKNERRRKPA